ncbi:MAG TPA: TonB-dependent receptor, partial [Casimicrobiaceae bacterium]|nr:TonB-dependent receptor [Casimicrobiaceae bacterium]
SLYGADAIGGVIQIFTRDTADRFTGHASAGHGTHDTRVLSAGLSGRIGALRLSVQAGGRRSEGFNATTPDASFIFDPDRDGYESEDVSARATLAIASGHEASVQLLRNRLDAQFDGGEGFDDRTLTTIELWRFESRNAFTSWWTSKASVGESRDESVSKSAFGDSPFRTRQREYAWQNEFVVPHGTVIVAAERREETIDEEAGFAVRRRNTNSLTAVGQFQRDAHAVQANIRHDQSDRQGGETTGAIAWGWQFRPGWRLTAGYSTAFKAPSFNDLYFPGFSNPDLEPERARSVEAGLHWQRNVGDVRLNARAIGWRNEVDELIVFQCDASFNCLPRNVASATLAGVTFGIDADWRNTTVKASLDVQSPRDDETGRLLPRRARRHGAWTLLHRIGPVRLGVEGIASSHRFDDAENTRRLAGYALLNVTAEWQLPHNVTLLARADNVTDRRHALASGFATPGTQLFAGVRWQP